MAQPINLQVAGALHPEAVVAPTVTRTYRELYSEASNNPTRERTAGFLSGYRFTDIGGNGVPTPATLRDQTVTLSDRQHMAFLALTTGQDGALEVVVLHRMLRYLDAPGDDPSGLHDHVIGLAGDILPHQYPAVDIPQTAFHLVGNAVRVPTVGAMTTLLPTWEDERPALGPYTEQDPETEVVRPRYLQLVPGRYAALLIHRRRVRPKMAYQEIVGAMHAQNETEACQDVITWLRAACTARGGGGALNALPSVLHTFLPLHLPPEAYRYVTAKVHADLPALAAIPDRGGVGGVEAAALLRTLGLARAADIGEAEDDRLGARAPKTIVDVYKETYSTLLRYCNVGTPEAVAPVWARLANCHKSEQHTVLMQELQKVCMARGLATELHTPVITTTLKQMVMGFQFAGFGIDDLTSGCQPFLVAYAGSANHYLAVAAANVGYRSIREKEKVKFPRDISEVCITMNRYAILCQCLFQGAGPPHPFVEMLWATAAGFQNSAPFMAERFYAVARHPGLALTYHARILRAIQVSVHEYMQQVASNVVDGIAGIDLPNFNVLIQELKRGTFHNSTNWVDIPDQYLDAHPSQSGGAPTSTGSSGGASTTATQASTRTGVSTITADTHTRPSSVARVENTAGDPEFAGITLRPGGTRNILREHRPPTNDVGNEFCVAWWTKGGCFPNCGRRATHVPFASASERTRLLTYVRTHLQAPGGGAT